MTSRVIIAARKNILRPKRKFSLRRGRVGAVSEASDNGLKGRHPRVRESLRATPLFTEGPRSCLIKTIDDPGKYLDISA